MTYNVPENDFKRFLIRASKEAKNGLPDHFPDISEIDDIIGDELFETEMLFRKDVLFYFVSCMIYGFFRDRKWHELHPECCTMSLRNLVSYLFTPCDELEPHIGIWTEKAAWKVMEDRQAAFEYMQGIILNTDIYCFSNSMEAAEQEEAG